MRCNAIAPAARTRLTAGLMGDQAAPAADVFDASDPANVSPFVAYLATESCPIAGKVFFVFGGAVHLFQPWTIIDSVKADHRWTVAELAEATHKWGDVTFDQSIPM